MPPSGGLKPPPTSSADQFPVCKTLFNKYEIGRLLGCGAFAKVYHARNRHSNQSVAIKVVSKIKVLKLNLTINVKREISIMHRLRHPHIVRLLEVLATRSKIFFVMEFVKGGELFTRIKKGRLPETGVRQIFHQLISAVGFCHYRGVFHRDLKPENLLLDEAGNLKVSDFGLSAVSDPNLQSDNIFQTLCGTPAYVAPEILSKKGYDGAKVDMWSCGVILFVLNAGYLPFNDANLMNMYKKIYRGEYRIPKWTSPELRILICRLLDTNPDTRITVDGIIHDPWFRKGLQEEKMRAMMTFHAEVEERLRKSEMDRELNAFDIISISSGVNLSGLFDGESDRGWFVSSETAEMMLEKVEEVGREEGLVVRKRKEKLGRGGVAVEGQNGSLVAWMEVYRLSPGLVVVEVETSNAKDEGRWNSTQFWKEKLGKAEDQPVEPLQLVNGNQEVGLTESQPVDER